LGEQPYFVIDTGGFEPVAKGGILAQMARQTRAAIAECDVVVFIVDARAGLSEVDRDIATMLRKSGRPVVLVANKAEGLPVERAVADFHELGLGAPLAISAAHGEGVRDMLEQALAYAPAPSPAPEDEGETGAGPARIKVAIVGRPNVGKSTLVNALFGAERVIAFDEPGTTRDAIHLDVERGGRPYTLIDTAGLRRRGKVFEAVEKFSVIKTLNAIEEAHVVVLVVDAQDEITEQDAHIAGHVLESGRALVVAVNKWDGLPESHREEVKREFSRKLAFLAFATTHYVSAREGRGLDALVASVDAAYAAAMAKLSTPRLTRALQQAVERQQPPRAGYSRPKLRYAHQGGMNPPVVVIHGTALASVPDTYRRYLERFFAEAFQLRGTPLRIQFKTGANPYVNKASRRRG
jgi:GTP-binding protein